MLTRPQTDAVTVVSRQAGETLPEALKRLCSAMFPDGTTLMSTIQSRVEERCEAASTTRADEVIAVNCHPSDERSLGICVPRSVSTEGFVVVAVNADDSAVKSITQRLKAGRADLLNAANTDEFLRILEDRPRAGSIQTQMNGNAWKPFAGLIGDAKRRLPHYGADFVDGCRDSRAVQKTISTTFFLFFSILLPLIAFGTLNSKNTDGSIDVRRTLTSQAIGGIVFALVSGQPLVILMTTAPLSLYIQVIYRISSEWQVPFATMYAYVGIFNSVFLAIYATFNASRIMRWCTRSTEEIFSLFITVAFFVDAFKDIVHNFERNYSSCSGQEPCHREVSLLSVILMVATVWLGLSLFNFAKSVYLSGWSRRIISDYALPVSVIVVSLLGVLLFPDIVTSEPGGSKTEAKSEIPLFAIPDMSIEGAPLIICVLLGFSLSLLFLMDQNISAAMVEAPEHRLEKGSAYDWDILVVALLNLGLSIFCFPWMHGVLPHSPLHAKALADVRNADGGQVVVKCRETRLTSLFAHFLMALSLLMLPQPLGSIPTAVLDGLFLYMAISSLAGNQFYERVLLLFTERKSYPAHRYVAMCTPSSIHIFTSIQTVQLAVFIFFGFSPWPYVTMTFPVVIMGLLAVRQLLVPRLVPEKDLLYLDTKEIADEGKPAT